MTALDELPQKTKLRRWSLQAAWRALGPGLVTGAADDDPSGIATYSQAGAQFGFALTWTVLLTLPFMVAIQIISGCIGWQTRAGLARTIARHLPRPVLYGIVILLVAANTINIAADLAAMGEALRLVIGGSPLPYALAFGLGCLIAEVLVPYHRYAGYLKLLTLVLLVYVVAAFTIDVPWGAVAVATFVPTISLDRDFLLTIVALFGTTISPYLFFWQASQEVEEEKAHGRHTLAQRRGATAHELADARLDVVTGIGVSNLVFYFIVLTTGATLHAAGARQIQSAREAAEALRPLAGDAAYALFALGIIGTGLLAVPVLAGSASFAVAELFGWRAGLDLSPRRGRRFYLVLAGAVAGGMVLDLFEQNPVRALFLSAVVNGVLAPPLLALVMLVGSNRHIMGPHTSGHWLTLLGWTATGAMGLAAAALLASVAAGWAR